MADNFDMKKFLVENKLGAYSRLKEESNKQKLIDAGYSESDAEDFSDEFEQGGSKVPQKVKDILAKENKTAEDLFQMFKDEDLVNDRHEYDEEDLMSTYPGLSEKEAEKLVNMLQNIDEKLAKEDIGGDIGDAEAEKMMDFLAEEEEEVEEAIDIHKVESADEKAQNLMRNISTNSNIPTLDKEGLISAIQELMDFIEDVGYEAERDMNENSYLMAKNPDVKAKVDKIIELLIDIDVDGETMEYIHGAVGMDDQMANQYHNKAEYQSSQMNEALEPHVYERMYNLSNIKAQQAMVKSAEILMNDLTAEGFEVPEIREFFNQLIANDI